MESLEWFWLNSLAIILALSFINKYKERKGGVMTCISVATSTDADAKDDDATEVAADDDDATTVAADQLWDSGGNYAKFATEDHTGDLIQIDVQDASDDVAADDDIDASDVTATDDVNTAAVASDWSKDSTGSDGCDRCPTEAHIAELAGIGGQENVTQGIELTDQQEVNPVEKSEISFLNLTGNQSQSITSTCDFVTIESLREIFTNPTKEVWAFMETKNQIYSAQIIMTKGSLLLKSLSKRAPPVNTVRIQYQDVKNLINRNNITTFLEINLGRGDNSDGSSIFIHIQLKGEEGRTKQFELMCTGEEDGISYAKTTFLVIESSPLSAIWGGARNDGHGGAIGGYTTGGDIIKTVTPGLVAGSFQRSPTHFVIYTEGNEDYKENYTIGKVVFGLNDIHVLYSQANAYGSKSINIDDCGIVLAGTQLKSIPSPITIEYLKEMVTQFTSGVWAVLRMKDQEYFAQIVYIKGYLLLKSLSNRAPLSKATTIPYQEVKNLVNRDNITIFLDIKLSEKENSNSGNRFIHIKLFGNQGRHQQFEVMCTGEVDGISYAKTDFMDILESPGHGIWGGARNDGLDTELPGFTRGESGRTYISPGLVAGFYDSIPERKPTHFIIYTEEASHNYQESSSIGKVVHGLNDIHMLYPYAKINGAAYIEIDDCGIVLD